MNPFLSVLNEFGYHQTSDYAKGAKRIDYYAPDHHWKTNIQVVTHLRKGEPYKFEWRGAGMSGGSSESSLRTYLEQDRAKYEGMVERHRTATGEFSPGRQNPMMSMRDRSRLRKKQNQLIKLAEAAGYNDAIAIDEGGPTIGQMREIIYLEWEGTIDRVIADLKARRGGRRNPDPGWSLVPKALSDSEGMTYRIQVRSRPRYPQVGSASPWFYFQSHEQLNDFLREVQERAFVVKFNFSYIYETKGPRGWQKGGKGLIKSSGKSNPSPGWFDRCMEGVSRSGSAYDPGAVCGALEKKMGYSRRNPAIKPRGFKTEASRTLWYKEYTSLRAAEKKLQELLHEGYRAAINFLNGKHRVRVGMDDGPGAEFEENRRRRNARYRAGMPVYNSKGWVLGSCNECGNLDYVEPHGTSAYCTRQKKETEHSNIPYEYRDMSGTRLMRRPPKANPRAPQFRISPFGARQILSQVVGELGADFHTLSSSQVDELLAEANKVGYRKSKSAPGSRGRMFYQYLQRVARRINGGKRTRGSKLVAKRRQLARRAAYGRPPSSSKRNPGRYTVIISGTAWVQGHELIISAKSSSAARSEAKAWYKRQFPGKKVPGMSVTRTAWIDTAPNKRKKRNRKIHTPTASGRTIRAVERRISGALRRYASRKPNRTRRRRY